MDLITSMISLITVALLIVLIVQMRWQRIATEALMQDSHVRTQLYEDADESTTFILGRTIQNISAGHSDPNLESDSFALKVVRELVKHRVSRDKWLEMQSNERLVLELYLLLRESVDKKGLHDLQANA